MAALIADRSGAGSGATPPTRIEHMTDQTVELARQLAQSIANEADADQWSISLVGLKGVSEGELEELLPPTWLQALNGGRAARYRMTLLLYACGRPIGTVRLATIRPSGFSDPEVRHARSMANRVGIMMADALDHCTAVESLARERNHPNGA